MGDIGAHAAPTLTLAGMRVGFAGTPEFAATALQAILAAGATVPLVLTQPDRPAGRGMKLSASAVKTLALTHGLDVIQPRSLRLDGKYRDDAVSAQSALEAARLDALVVAAYGLILPMWVLNTPRLGCFNIHGSLLPRWRGAAPIHRAIEAGDVESGITIMQMDAGLDTGDMLAMQSVSIGANENTAQLHDRLSALGAEMMVATLAVARDRKLIPVVQPADGAGVTYAHKVDKSEANLDWSRGADELARQVRAFNPSPGAWTSRELRADASAEVWKIWDCYVINSSEVNESGEQGRIIHQNGSEMAVLCVRGRLGLAVLQRAGGKRLGVADFLRGVVLGPNERLVML